jgi:predicted  nucleic acid-binding Zn-ribbon protein
MGVKCWPKWHRRSVVCCDVWHIIHTVSQFAIAEFEAKKRTNASKLTSYREQLERLRDERARAKGTAAQEQLDAEVQSVEQSYRNVRTVLVRVSHWLIA